MNNRIVDQIETALHVDEVTDDFVNTRVATKLWQNVVDKIVERTDNPYWFVRTDIFIFFGELA